MARPGRLNKTEGIVDEINGSIESGNNSKVISVLVEEGVDSTDGF